MTLPRPERVVERTVVLDRRARSVGGIHPDDPYFCGLTDGMEERLATVGRALLSRDAVCCDIGANIGITAMILSDIVPEGRVHAFEPSPTVFPVLSDNLTRNGCENVVAHRMAIGEITGEACLFDKSAYGFLARSNFLSNRYFNQIWSAFGSDPV